MRTLTIASAASAAAAAVTSQLWIAGTWIAAALTPVLVALISEALHRPTERVVRARTTRRTAAGSPAMTGPRVVEPEGESIRVYRQPGTRPFRRRIALGAAAATAALAFVIGIAALTTLDLVSGGSVGKGSGRTTLLGGGNGDRTGTSTDDRPSDDNGQTAPDADQPADEPTSTAPAPSDPPEDQPSNTTPAPTPPEPVPGEPEQPAVP